MSHFPQFSLLHPFPSKPYFQYIKLFSEHTELETLLLLLFHVPSFPLPKVSCSISAFSYFSFVCLLSFFLFFFYSFSSFFYFSLFSPPLHPLSIKSSPPFLAPHTHLLLFAQSDTLSSVVMYRCSAARDTALQGCTVVWFGRMVHCRCVHQNTC